MFFILDKILLPFSTHELPFSALNLVELKLPETKLKRNLERLDSSGWSVEISPDPFDDSTLSDFCGFSKKLFKKVLSKVLLSALFHADLEFVQANDGELIPTL